MPQHRFLFEEAKKGDDDAIAVRKDKENVYYKPTKDGAALVDYLLSLKGANYPLEEAPVYQPFTSSLPKPAAPAEEKDGENTEEEDGGEATAEAAN